MLRSVVEARGPVAMILAALTGTWGTRTYPASTDDGVLGMIAAATPHVYRLLAYGDARLWFVTAYFAASLLLSFVAIVVYRRAPSVRVRPLPPYPHPEAEHRTESGTRSN